MFKYKFPKADITVDVIIVNKKDEMLLVKRKNEPYKDCWAIPGGYLNVGKESIEDAARREVKEETDLDTMVKFWNYYDTPDRDPRGVTITMVFIALVLNDVVATAGDDAKEVKWVKIDEVLNENLAFDHKKIITEFMKCFEPKHK